MSTPVPPANTASPRTIAAGPAIRATALPTPETPPLTPGQVLQAQVVARTAGQLIVRTDGGTLTLQTSAAPDDGSTLLLRVLTGGDRPQLEVSLRPGVPAAAGTPNTGTVLTQGGLVTATFAGNGASVPSAAAGQILPLENGAAATLRILGVAPPGAATVANAHASAAAGNTVLSATVTALSPQGAPIAQTSAGAFAINTITTLPVGTRLLFELLPSGTPVTATSEVLAAGDPLASLRDAIAALRSGDGALSASLSRSALPQIGPRLSTGMLFILSAVFSGDLRRVFSGDALRNLARTGPDLVQRLGADLGTLQQAATDAAGQDWRGYLLPLLTDTGLERLRLLVRDQDADDVEAEDSGIVRFLVEVTMSRLGAFQFDGKAGRKTLDLVVRTHRPLDADMQNDIRRIFENTLAAMTFIGTLLFQTVPTFESPIPETAAPAKKGLVV
ncbi:MAG: hypothetical protein OEU46_05110 [Alphaproteobacteria bacterium]|nr:hypothetical protein [Alphaproteobacteria bacterium]